MPVKKNGNLSGKFLSSLVAKLVVSLKVIEATGFFMHTETVSVTGAGLKGRAVIISLTGIVSVGEIIFTNAESVVCCSESIFTGTFGFIVS